MPEARTAVLPDRGVVSVKGEDAAKLIGGIITNDIARLDGQEALFAGLLTPQGKILFDFLVVKVAGGFLLDVARDKAADLVKRLTLYKLRAKVEIGEATVGYSVVAAWGGAAADLPGDGARTEMGPAGDVPVWLAARAADPRVPSLGERWLVLSDGLDILCSQVLPLLPGASLVTAADYHAHRIAIGVPEGGKDYVFGDTFPHEACFDHLNGVSFDKGCYVGQEVVSRMQHRGTARKRIVKVSAGADLPATGTEIVAGEVPVGTMGSSAGRIGLALVRLDRAAEAGEKGVPLTAAGIPVKLERPAWATFDMRGGKTAEQP